MSKSTDISNSTDQARLTAAFLWHNLGPFTKVYEKQVAACVNCGKPAIVSLDNISGQAVESGCELGAK